MKQYYTELDFNTFNFKYFEIQSRPMVQNMAFCLKATAAIQIFTAIFHFWNIKKANFNLHHSETCSQFYKISKI